ncbi:microcystin degradation protein MlrC [Microtetraspora sp. NBRC 13810]|uniref:M81 family metallopeptidase n=1 Tax=Microtetraspora sp. NBRC 13810 TaxID=3030990 RepID=UPI0024A0A7DE|nr:M81 family metallopeptidase [Microtetraspora sp. NBRC 13810]GLW10454.1 microcystin degradation protein MlrC [Microtetraspora sp. NBRC 13810]
MTPLRIGIAGIAIESSTFSPHRTRLPDFRVTRDEALLARYPWIQEPRPWCAEVTWVPLLHAVSLPGGAVEPEVYDALEAEIVARAEAAGPLDGLFFDIHGAMSVVGRTDAEAGLARAVREAVGPDTLISTSMDLHGNVSRELATTVDLITCYRMAPHEDAWESKERAARNLVARLRDGGRPLKAWVQVPVLLPGEKTSTRIEPAKGIYARVPEVEALPGVLDAAIWVGYAWADEPRCRAAVVVTGDDAEVITEQARTLAESYWAARDDFAFVAPTGTLDECVTAAIAGAKPFLISDSGDNPTAGGAGDVSATLGRLLEVDELRSGAVSGIYASIVDPDAVAVARTAGQGATVTVYAGGKIDPGPAGPVELTGTVYSLLRDDPVGGDIAVIETGGLRVILTSLRKPYHEIADFTRLGLAPAETDLVIVKIGYLEPELYDLAADWLLALTPGGVDQDLLRLGHHGVRRPLFPFDADMTSPDLTPELL